MIEYDMTPERDAYLKARGYIVLSACPGSGKTTSIVQKLYSVSQYCKENYGKHTGFACLSFTNRASDEIKDKYRQMHDEILEFPNVVSTIDSFITQNIILPFWYLFPSCKTRPQIINEKDVIRQLYFAKGQYPIPQLRQHKQYLYRYAPEEISIDHKGYFCKGRPMQENMKDYCSQVVKMRYESGNITSQDALVMAVCIVKKHPEIARTISRRYPYIIVDEAQDNSYLQFKLFEILIDNGLHNLEFVGDVCQSIYRYRNAHPELFAALMSTEGWQNLHFTDCRRSNQRIIDFYSKLRPQDIPEIKSCGVEDKKIPIVVYKHKDGEEKKIIDDFRNKVELYGLDTYGIMFRGHKKLESLSDNKKTLELWKSCIPYMLIDAIHLKQRGDFDQAFRKVRLALAFAKYGDKYKERNKFISDIEYDLEWNRRIFLLVDRISNFTLSLEDWTILTENEIKRILSLSCSIDFQIKSKLPGYHMAELKKESVSKYFLEIQDKESNVETHTDTIHSYKGTSLDAVLLFLSKNGKGQSVSLNDFPDQPISKIGDMTERQSMIYVACSRAKQFLAIAVPYSVDDNVIAKKFSDVKYSLIKL